MKKKNRGFRFKKTIDDVITHNSKTNDCLEFYFVLKYTGWSRYNLPEEIQ
jgi:hypothetical protein